MAGTAGGIPQSGICRMHHLVFILSAVLIVGLAYFAVPWLAARWLKFRLRRASSGIKLSFDDGPGLSNTPLLLKALDNYPQKASFYLLGKRSEQHPEIVRQISETGHEICSHGYEHCNYWKISPWRAIKDIQKGWQIIDAALGRTNRNKYPFRPPYGKMTLPVLVYLLINKVPIRYWSFDSGDTFDKLPDVSDKVRELITQKKGVVLLHDFDRDNRERNEFVLSFVEAALNIKETDSETSA